MNQELTVVNQSMPALTIQESVSRYNALIEFVKGVMKPGADFGVIPGTDKPTLLKPGAEKLCTLFALMPRFTITEKIMQWGDDGTEPLFYFAYKCQLWRGDALMAEGEGSCNSREKKYRYRGGERKCPYCGKPTIIKGKAEYGGGWLCFAKKGGCGSKFKENDQAITGQQVGQVINPDIADQINTLQKMAQKRALIAATLIAVNASEFFTQDIEDMGYIEGDYTVAVSRQDDQPRTEQTQQQTTQKATPQSATVNGAAKKQASIKTRNFQHLVTELATETTYYNGDDGKPNNYHILGSAAKCGYTEITDDNIAAVLQDLISHAAEQTVTQS